MKRLPHYTIVVSTSGTFPSLHHKSKNFGGFDVLLESPVSLIKGNRYYIEDDISGAESFGGRHGNIHVESSGVTFKFENRTKDFCGGTGIEKGQLPEFIFSIRE